MIVGHQGLRQKFPFPNLQFIAIILTSGHQQRRETFNRLERHGITFPSTKKTERSSHRQTHVWIEDGSRLFGSSVSIGQCLSATKLPITKI
jgi:hypothetical protein